MNKQRFTYNQDAVVKSHRAAFGILDEKGRECGFCYGIVSINAVPAGERGWWVEVIYRPGQWFMVNSSATRNGTPYGASTATAYFETFEQAQAEADRRVEVARKRYARKYAAK